VLANAAVVLLAAAWNNRQIDSLRDEVRSIRDELRAAILESRGGNQAALCSI